MRIFIFFLSFFVVSSGTVYAGTLSCSVATTCPSGTVILKMYDTADTHAELANQPNYTQLICCTGVSGLGNSCSGTYAVAAKLSTATNAHIEQNSQSNYANNACISVSSGNVSVGYQANNCTGYDTTLASMSGITNAHIGDGNAYVTKICATANASGGSVSADIVDSAGNPVVSPSFSFSSTLFAWNTQQPTATLGVSSQKIRVTSGVSNWTVSISATGGPTALWQSGGNNYDFNGSASVGRLKVDSSVAVLTPQGGCSATGLSKGSSAYFSQGTQDSVTLLTGTAAQTGCYFDLTGVDMVQDIPVSQATGNYTLNMTITAA